MNRGTARYPLLEIDLDKLKANLAALIERCQSLSVEVTGVVKGFSALPEAAGVYTECGVRSLASSRLSQLRALRGAGDTLVPSVINLATMWVVRIGLALILIKPLGLLGMWIAMAAELSTRGLLMLYRQRTSRFYAMYAGQSKA